MRYSSIKNIVILVIISAALANSAFAVDLLHNFLTYDPPAFFTMQESILIHKPAHESSLQFPLLFTAKDNDDLHFRQLEVSIFSFAFYTTDKKVIPRYSVTLEDLEGKIRSRLGKVGASEISEFEMIDFYGRMAIRFRRVASISTTASSHTLIHEYICIPYGDSYTSIVQLHITASDENLLKTVSDSLQTFKVLK